MAAEGPRFIDIGGNHPRIRIALLVSTTIGTVIYGWYIGALETWRGFWDAFEDALAGLQGYIETEIIGGFFGIVTDSFQSAAAANAAYLRDAGTLGIVIGVVEVLIVVYGVLWVVSTAVSRARGSV
jgi:hypothetical protein